MTGHVIWQLVAGTVQGLTAAVMFVLTLLAGVCVLLGLRKLRHGGGRNAARSLDELVGEERFARYLKPDDPRGTVDQLRTPELLESAARKSS